LFLLLRLSGVAIDRERAAQLRWLDISVGLGVAAVGVVMLVLLIWRERRIDLGVIRIATLAAIAGIAV
jgi:hypothetical protein